MNLRRDRLRPRRNERVRRGPGWRFFVVAEKESPPPPPTAHLISTPHYEVRITDPGFRMEVSTADGVALPADPTAGLLFSGHPAVSSEEIHRADGLATFRVANGNGQTALAEVKTGTHTIEVTMTLENGHDSVCSRKLLRNQIRDHPVFPPCGRRNCHFLRHTCSGTFSFMSGTCHGFYSVASLCLQSGHPVSERGENSTHQSRPSRIPR